MKERLTWRDPATPGVAGEVTEWSDDSTEPAGELSPSPSLPLLEGIIHDDDDDQNDEDYSDYDDDDDFDLLPPPGICPGRLRPVGVIASPSSSNVVASIS